MMYRRMIILGFLLTLVGCEVVNDHRKIYIRDRGQDYLTSDLVAPLQVSEPLTQYHSDVFPLPDVVPDKDGLNNISLKPPGFGETL